MKEYILTFQWTCVLLPAFADHIPGPEPTEPSMLANTWVIGVFAVVLLLIVRRVRKRRAK